MGIGRYTIRRILQTIPVLVGIVTITFFLTDAIPGDPVQIMLGPSPSARDIELVRAKYGLDKPLWVRYINYLADVSPIWLWPKATFPFVELQTGVDLGKSIYYSVPVTQKIMERLPVTLLLVASAFVFAIVTAIPLGVLSAKRRNKPTDHVARVVSLIGVSTPSFWIGLMLIIVFAYHLDVLPATGLILPWANPAEVSGAENRIHILMLSFIHLIMPTITLGTLQMAAITRIERSSMLENLSEEYVRLARAYGVRERTILRKHAFRPAQLPIITIIGLNLTAALGGSVLTEVVFNINGMGRLIITAINNQDYPLVMGTTIYYGMVFVIGVIVTDISYAYIDPRVSYGEAEA
ncbi:ABC transporter permease [Halobacteriales archaeon QS_1_68_20]|nr:MAG: ABC transporter permease [Halobacteriales archaeon QS_1_68_20]